ncbi:MAG: helix-turn-helix transcriptional regulator [Bryobacteraceae bacterium]|nr:helix-turn-helix transcriptional regulator [Bryobacteraceae bacterium]
MRQTSGIQWENAAQVIEPRVTASGIHVYPFDPAFPMQVRFLTLRSPSSVAPRRHDYFEVLYMESGSVVYRVPDRDVQVNQGDLFVIGSHIYHGIREYITPTVRAVVLYFHPSLILGENTTIEGAEYLVPFEIQGAGFPHGISASTGIPVQVLDLIRRIHQETASSTPRAQLAMKTYLKMILVLLMNYYASNVTTTGAVGRKNRNLERLQPLFDYVDHHYVENISVEQAAGLLRMSKSHFMRFFRAVTGQAFVSHLNRFRIGRAQHLMATTDFTIAAITQEVGFCDQSYFGVVFRRFVGMTPREYRDRLRAA